ncbi:BamA/OMP85 family outer membrane protein [Anatilimnocola aggregata]|uniref:BamA/OMP85 family outer membrane protein n=1 Tax=Anatilimnocola aggregata TaxID=2528021 RepID=UPI00192E3984|nr:POTRA domain-containing protein [Anatilimnocola aggregata]
MLEQPVPAKSVQTKRSWVGCWLSCGLLLASTPLAAQGPAMNAPGNYQQPGYAPPQPPAGYAPPALPNGALPPPANPQQINLALNPQGAPEQLPGVVAQPQQLVVDVQILGIAQTKEHTVQKYLHTRRDREFDPELVQSDVRRLVTSGLFRDVRTYTRQVPAGVIVIYEIFERPRIKYIKHIGNRGVGEKKLLKEHGLKVGDALNSYSAEEGRRKIEEYYHKQGHPKAQVTVMEGDKATDQGLVYFINEGNLERISQVVFRGNTIASDARLKTQIESKPGFMWYFFGGKIDRQKLDSDSEKITSYYRRLGYFRARVGRELELDESGSWVTLRFVIDEGPRYTVRSVKIEGTQKFPEQPLLGFMEIKQGEYFHQDKMNRDVNTIVDLYGSKGYVFADVQADPRFLEEPGQLDLVYRVQEGEVFYIGDINVHVGGEYPHTRDTVVLNRAGIRPGDLADMREIRNWERRLKSSQLFETNPQEGEAPKVVLGTPSIGNVNTIARGSGSQPTIRGQSPEAGAANYGVRPASYQAESVRNVVPNPNAPQLPTMRGQQGPYSPQLPAHLDHQQQYSAPPASVPQNLSNPAPNWR